jgi:undecaprenyl-phosphate galactose phosphotransferase
MNINASNEEALPNNMLKIVNANNKEKTKNVKFKIYKVVKRVIDILISIVGLILLIPLTIVIGIANFLVKDSGPIFYTQERIGKNGKTFKLYKYRTMIVNADDKLSQYLAENEEIREEFRKNQKLKNDPRITKLGKILRKTSLDEFPQFINVFKGEMSLIGPRPLIKGELDLHKGNHELYEKLRPGITGWWACNGRSDTTYEQRLDLEYYYTENCSLWLDIKIIFATMVKVIKKEGAM